MSQSLRLTFKNRNQHNLSAILDLPQRAKPKAMVLFAHCFTCNKNFNAPKYIAHALVQSGFAVFRFDFTGLGKSEGEFAESNFIANQHDLEDAAAFLEKEYEGPSLLIGHSLGGAAVIFASKNMPNVKAIATIGAPFNPHHVINHFKDSIAEIKAKGKGEVTIGGRKFNIDSNFIEALENTDTEKCLNYIKKKSLLILHSPQDEVVGIDNAAAMYQAAHHPKSFVSLDGADHMLSNKADSEYTGTLISSWAKRYINYTENENTLNTKSKVATQTFNHTLTTNVMAEGHALLGDEPETVGGNNLGPTPYGFLLSALGCCTSLTLQMYAKRKQWPLMEAKVHLDAETLNAKDCEECKSETGTVYKISRKLELIGDDLDEHQKSKLLEIANKCPVHKTLHNEILVNTELVD